MKKLVPVKLVTKKTKTSATEVFVVRMGCKSKKVNSPTTNKVHGKKSN